MRRRLRPVYEPAARAVPQGAGRARAARRARRSYPRRLRPGTCPSPSSRWSSTPRRDRRLPRGNDVCRAHRGRTRCTCRRRRSTTTRSASRADRPGPRQVRPARGGDRARDPPRRRARLRRRDVGQRDEARLRGARGRALPRAVVPRRRDPAHGHRRRPARRVHAPPRRQRAASPSRASAALEHTSTAAAGRVTRATIDNPAGEDRLRRAQLPRPRRGGRRGPPEAPLLFAKWPNRLIGDGEPILLPAESTRSTTRPSSAS